MTPAARTTQAPQAIHTQRCSSFTLIQTTRTPSGGDRRQHDDYTNSAKLMSQYKKQSLTLSFSNPVLSGLNTLSARTASAVRQHDNKTSLLLS